MSLIQLIIVIFILLIISFICSLLESVILSITRSYIQLLIDKKNRSGILLQKQKMNIEEPLSAILTLNTISHTVGAAISGAIALQIFGSEWMALFSAVLTLLILIFSEIIPKTIGAQYWKKLGPVSSYLLQVMIFVLKPVIIPIHYISRLISPEDQGSRISKAEVINYIRLGYFQGVVDTSELTIMENLFRLRSIQVKDIMTPRPVVFWLPPEQKIDDIIKTNKQLQFTRIPLYNAKKNEVQGVVLRREIMNRLVEKKTNVRLQTIAQSPHFVIETISVYRLLHELIAEKVHLSIVLNEFGDFTGIVTMEDAIETLLGMEIIDEFDSHDDMREYAKKRGARRLDEC